ncbi:zinc metalloprotease [Longimycelium tulufanense]|uniref:Zinc metalloprotease n=1 Tax=Longimycelium tulufanense TaxID=907463 RepID=A0A8J3C723_9PSEU|nr:site-2 protease family protein [Longimycelium tulufanense]GGM46432.1 zinc metalloprotease [Longimycelium tulufanense]
MRPTIRLGRVAGVRVGLHWSVVGIVLLVAVGLAGYNFPAVFPGYPTFAYVVAGVVAALLLLCSLLAHEVAHAVVARRNGLEVEGITLWLLGGVAQLRGEPRGPGADFRIAAVGPLASFLVALVFAVASWVGVNAGIGRLSVGVMAYLAVINVILAVFNLVPAAPLDGGRVLRAALWAWRGDRVQAAVWATRAGRGFGFLLIVLGVVTLLAGNGGGLWWILLGWFVVNMAAAEEQQARVGAALSGLRVRDVMTEHPQTVGGEQTVANFLTDVAVVRMHSTYPLVDNEGRLRGLVTLNRLREVPRERRGHTTLWEIARPPHEVPQAEPDEPLSSVLPRLEQPGDGRILVQHEGRIVGIISPSDISRAVARRGFTVGGRAGADFGQDTSRPPENWWYPGKGDQYPPRRDDHPQR